jgi:hypothetical protein
MKLNHFHLLLCIAIAMISSCGEPKTTEVVDNAQSGFKLPEDTVKFPYKRVNMEMDSVPTTIEVSYGRIACSCAQWVFNDRGWDDREYIYVEPASSQIKNADDLYTGNNVVTVRLKGKFYKTLGYPIEYDPVKGSPRPARVFRYTKLNIVKIDSLANSKK